MKKTQQTGVFCVQLLAYPRCFVKICVEVFQAENGETQEMIETWSTKLFIEGIGIWKIYRCAKSL